MPRYRSTWFWLGVFGTLSTAPAFAQDVERVDVSGSVNVLTDYRFRGLSRSDGKPVVRGDADASVSVASGTDLFAGGEVVAVAGGADYGNPQAQAYVGGSQRVGAVTLSAGARGYFFPGRSGRDYLEFFGSGRTQIGPLSGLVGVAIAPDQRANGGRRGLYVYSDFDVGIPSTPVTVAAHLGWEDDARFRNKADWSIGVTYVHSPWSLGLSYVDTNRDAPFVGGGRLRNAASAAPVLTVGVSF